MANLSWIIRIPHQISCRLPAKHLTLTILFLSALFTPTFPGKFGNKGMVFPNSLVMTIATAYLFLSKGTGFIRAELYAVSVFLLAFGYYFFSIVFSELFLSSFIIVDDLIELHKPLIHAASFFSAVYIIRRESDLSALVKILYASFYIIVILSTFQFFDNNIISFLFLKEESILGSRINIPFGNPYDYGFMIIFYSMFFVSRFIHKPTFLDGFSTLTAICALMLTKSRTGILALAISSCTIVPIFIAIHFRACRKTVYPVMVRYSLVFAAGLAAASALLMMYPHNFIYVTRGIGRLVTTGRQNSLTGRLNQLEAVVDMAEAKPIVAMFGNGVGKGVMRYLESAYTFFLFRFGAVGLLIVLLIPHITLIYVCVSRNITSGNRSSFVLAGVLWFSVFFIVVIGNCFTEQPRISFFYYFICGSLIRVCYMPKEQVYAT